MMTEQQMQMMLEMLSNPMFKQGANEFIKIAQQQGLAEANKFWGISNETQPFSGTEKIMEGMSKFYQNLGFVPQAKYDELVKENAKLKNENEVLRSTLGELQQKYMAEHGAKAQQAWGDIVGKQLEMSQSVTKSFFDALMPKPPKE